MLEIIGAIGAIFSSSGLGALVGLVGSWLTKREERKNLELKNNFAVQMAQIRKEEAQLEFNHELALADKQVERAQVEGQIQQDIGELHAFAEGLAEQQKTYGIQLVDGIRGLMRPVITAYLLILATHVTAKIGGYIGGIDGALQHTEMVTMYKDTIAQLMFLVTTAVTWWFGSRPTGRR